MTDSVPQQPKAPGGDDTSGSGVCTPPERPASTGSGSGDSAPAEPPVPDNR